MAQTATGLPHINVFGDARIAVGGRGAKSSDDWGWSAARLIAGKHWNHPVPRRALRLPHA